MCPREQRLHTSRSRCDPFISHTRKKTQDVWSTLRRMSFISDLQLLLWRDEPISISRSWSLSVAVGWCSLNLTALYALNIIHSPGQQDCISQTESNKCCVAPSRPARSLGCNLIVLQRCMSRCYFLLHDDMPVLYFMVLKQLCEWKL